MLKSHKPAMVSPVDLSTKFPAEILATVVPVTSRKTAFPVFET